MIKKITVFLLILLFIALSGGCSLFNDTDKNGEDEENTGQEQEAPDENGKGQLPELKKDEPITINDPNLLKSLQTLLKLEDEPITVEDMLDIETINFAGRGISDLTGLEYALNATFINLRDNSISDITPLKGLEKLERLILDRNRIKDITAVGGMVALKALEVRENLIEDIAAVSWGNMSRLNFIDIRYNFIDLKDPASEKVLDELYAAGANVMHDPIEPILDDW